MGLMTFLRNRAGYVLIGAIAFAIIAFIVGDLINTGRPFWEASQRVVGSIDGEEISIEQFSSKVDQSLEQMSQQYGGASGSPQLQAMAVDNVWQSEVASVLLNKEYTRLGLSISGDELFDLLQGKNPSPLIVQYFGNPETGQIDRAAIINSLKAQSREPRLKEQWDLLQAEVEKQALQQKYVNLVRNSVYVTSLEANDDYVNRNKLANFSYVFLDYNSLSENEVKVTDADYKAYYDANKKRYTNPVESRDIEFVSFSIQPTKADSLAVNQQMEQLAADFRNTPNDSLFAANNSEVKIPFAYLPKGRLDASVDSAVFSLPVGSFYGPKLTGNSYKLVKVVDSRFSPDSVKASHILIDPMKVGGEANAFKLADSLKRVAQAEGTFPALAKIFSVDGSKDAGGDLGTFGRGAMVPEFENACFDGRPGDYKVVKSQFGVHVIHIVKQIGSSKVVKLAYIERNLAASAKTRDVAYKAATSFLNEAKSETFASLAQKKGYAVQSASRVAASQGYAAGLDNPRQLIRAAYEAKKGAVLNEVYNMDDSYVVARLAAIHPKGELPLEAVKAQLTLPVLNAVKAKVLKERLAKALEGSSSLAQVAQKAKSEVVPVQNIVFANPIIPGLAQENKVVGAVFGSPLAKLSKVIEGERGVFVFSVEGFVTPAPIDNTYKHKENILSGVAQRALGGAFQALQDKADIKDYRVKFY